MKLRYDKLCLCFGTENKFFYIFFYFLMIKSRYKNGKMSYAGTKINKLFF